MINADLFIRKTKDGLNMSSEKYNENCIAPRGFDMGCADDHEEDCVLIIGLNPAGKEEDAEREKEPRTYFYSLPDWNSKDSKWVYNSYYSPIHGFAEKTVDPCGVKWPWCNCKWDDILSEVQNKETQEFQNAMKKYYDCHSTKKYTIYIGDMFYYHETSSKKLPLKLGFDFKGYCREMLEKHLGVLSKHNKRVKFVYINNAKVSEWLRNKDETYTTISDIPVFFGGMLSGQHPMDRASRARLIKEIRGYFQNTF